MKKNNSQKIIPVAVIIVVRNGLKTTQACLDSLLSEPVQEIVIVDNDSSDRTAEYLQKLEKNDKRILVIKNSFNNGFAGANNQGYAATKAEYVLFLNNDTVVEKDFLQPLLLHLKEDKKTAAVQPLILFPNHSIDSVGSFLTNTGFLYHKAHRQQPQPKILKHEYVYTLKGACMVWKRSVLEKIGVFDTDYFAYFEETDLCHRAINAGYRLLFCPESKITHLGGFTSNTMNPSFVQYHNYKNRIITYLRHLPLRDLITIVPIHLVLCELFVLYQLISAPLVAIAIQRGILVGLWRGLRDRKNSYKKPIDSIMKKPDLGYYKALFSSLEGYEKIW